MPLSAPCWGYKRFGIAIQITIGMRDHKPKMHVFTTVPIEGAPSLHKTLITAQKTEGQKDRKCLN